MTAAPGSQQPDEVVRSWACPNVNCPRVYEREATDDDRQWELKRDLVAKNHLWHCRYPAAPSAQPDEVQSVTHAFVRTVSTIHPANPYLLCGKCRQPVHHFSNTGEGEGSTRNQPCDHAADYDDTCPSWSPVDGCRCAQQLGQVPHPAQPVRDTEEGRR